jgi:hypothetical protein
MHFSIIYSVDIPRHEAIGNYMPNDRLRRRRFDMTEGDESYDYNYLADETPGNDYWRNGKHRKLCAILSKQEFEEFLFDTGLFPEDVETLGSIGAPGFGFSLAPAISFTNDDPEAIQSAYVTPIPLFNTVNDGKLPEFEGFNERSWQRTRRAVIEHYSY